MQEDFPFSFSLVQGLYAFHSLYLPVLIGSFVQIPGWSHFLEIQPTYLLERVILKAEEIKTIFLLYFFNLNKGRGLKNGKILIFDI